jgi:NitT/TauT family transport system substrate-binding protein
MNPPDMAAALSSGALDAYYVGEPFAAQTLKSGDAQLVHYVESVWPGFICNLMLVKGSLIDRHPHEVQQLVNGAVRSGLWAKNHLEAVADIAAQYWNQDPALIRYALNTPERRIVFDQFTPKKEELQYLGNLMQRFGLTPTADIDGLVYAQFARQVPLGKVTTLNKILP